MIRVVTVILVVVVIFLTMGVLLAEFLDGPRQYMQRQRGLGNGPEAQVAPSDDPVADWFAQAEASSQAEFEQAAYNESVTIIGGFILLGALIAGAVAVVIYLHANGLRNQVDALQATIDQTHQRFERNTDEAMVRRSQGRIDNSYSFYQQVQPKDPFNTQYIYPPSSHVLGNRRTTDPRGQGNRTPRM
jgi:predicted PurR-regulated permease PerM